MIGRDENNKQNKRIRRDLCERIKLNEKLFTKKKGIDGGFSLLIRVYLWG